MMKIAVFITIVFAVVQGQRPPYAGRPNRYPQVLPQYLDPSTSEPGMSENPLVDNRIDGTKLPSTINAGGSSIIPPPSRPFRDPMVLPPQAGGNWDVIDEVSKWPVEHQPFWFLNWKHIQAHIGGRQPPSPTMPRKQ